MVEAVLAMLPQIAASGTDGDQWVSHCLVSAGVHHLDSPHPEYNLNPGHNLSLLSYNIVQIFILAKLSGIHQPLRNDASSKEQKREHNNKVGLSWKN